MYFINIVWYNNSNSHSFAYISKLSLSLFYERPEKKKWYTHTHTHKHKKLLHKVVTTQPRDQIGHHAVLLSLCFLHSINRS